MNICNEKIKSTATAAIPGHLYYCDDVIVSFGKLALACIINDNIRLVSLYTGEMWAEDSTFEGYNWIDVTNQYCLKKVD